MSDNELSIEEMIKKINEGDLSMIDGILDVHLNQENDNKYLKIIANAFCKFIKPVEWSEYQSSIDLFAEAVTEDNESLKILSELFLRSDLLEFTKFFFSSISKIIINQPERIVNILLFIASRAAQNSPQFYAYAVPALFSSIAVHLDRVNFQDFLPAFTTFIDFEPNATTQPLQELMIEKFTFLYNKFEQRNVNQLSFYATDTFLNLMKFFQPFAFRYEKFKQAYLILAVKSINEDPSLTINPFRIKILEILINAEHYLQCVAPLTKILTKALQEKRHKGNDFDWDKLLIADKEIARLAAYQDLLFDKSMSLLKLCLSKLSNHIAYPEIVAPVVRACKLVVDDTIFQPKQKELRAFIKEIEKQSKLINEKREKLASSDPNFKIIEHKEI